MTTGSLNWASRRSSSIPPITATETYVGGTTHLPIRRAPLMIAIENLDRGVPPMRLICVGPWAGGAGIRADGGRSWVTAARSA